MKMELKSYYEQKVSENCLFLFKNHTKIHLSEIILLEAVDNYTVIYLKNGKPIIIARTLKSFENSLKSFSFQRIHHSYIINLKHLEKYNPENGKIDLTNNFKAIASRRKRGLLEKQIDCSTS
jgi:DNA-binding LytR/AlgR family response regulator